MMIRSIIDDIINTSKMSDIPKNFINDSNMSTVYVYTYAISPAFYEIIRTYRGDFLRNPSPRKCKTWEPCVRKFADIYIQNGLRALETSRKRRPPDTGQHLGRTEDYRGINISGSCSKNEYLSIVLTFSK